MIFLSYLRKLVTDLLDFLAFLPNDGPVEALLDYEVLCAFVFLGQKPTQPVSCIRPERDSFLLNGAATSTVLVQKILGGDPRRSTQSPASFICRIFSLSFIGYISITPFLQGASRWNTRFSTLPVPTSQRPCKVGFGLRGGGWSEVTLVSWRFEPCSPSS